MILQRFPIQLQLAAGVNFICSWDQEGFGPDLMKRLSHFHSDLSSHLLITDIPSHPPSLLNFTSPTWLQSLDQFSVETLFVYIQNTLWACNYAHSLIISVSSAARPRGEGEADQRVRRVFFFFFFLSKIREGSRGRERKAKGGGRDKQRQFEAVNTSRPEPALL